ncbi:hypothetical protein CC80DRAFT_532200 [Byssothecium circinans]|uniref:Ubiquitin 3 binding protein But2 C-terminal domain-containing protein n=1 Tax=Byssothecium circinans TaxID=147558 RepID=A0A6A5U6M9_9PLEO|nr:hypothetical protein CC80DRAFT_532200 [Byssothecium circinans]
MHSSTLITALLTSIVASAPTSLSLEKRFPSGPNVITPTFISVYNINTGGLTYQPSLGKASFAQTTTTISAFNIPANVAGKKCSLHFYLDSGDAAARFTGPASSQVLQVFSTNSVPPQHSVPSWGPPGNQRNEHYGNLKLVKPGDATVDDYPRKLESFDCPAQGTYAWEVVAKWDVGVEWGNGAGSGLYLKWV